MTLGVYFLDTYIHFLKKIQNFLSKAGRLSNRFLDIQKFHIIPKMYKLLKKVHESAEM
jgi:hypothetical protein